MTYNPYNNYHLVIINYCFISARLLNLFNLAISQIS